MSDQKIFCPFCGFQNTKDAKFCMGCGANIAERLSSSEKNYEKPLIETQFTTSPATPPSEKVVTPSTPITDISNSNATTNQKTAIGSPNNIRYADSERLIAFIIDIIIISLIGLFFGFATGLNMISFSDSGSILRTIYNSSVVETIIGFLYFWLLECFNNGQTLGKLVFKIRTVDMVTFGRINPQQALIHILGKALYAVYGLILFLDVVIGSLGSKTNPIEKNQIRLTQRLAKTVVIKI